MVAQNRPNAAEPLAMPASLANSLALRLLRCCGLRGFVASCADATLSLLIDGNTTQIQGAAC